MTRALRACAPTLAALLCACSALGLGDYERVPCTRLQECEALSASLPPDACERYYCTASGRGCELRPTDLDDDQHPDADVCADDFSASELDCDDHDPERYRGRDEVCNGRDDDCDGFVDEGMWPIGQWQRKPIDAGVVDVASAQLRDGTEVLALTRPTGSAAGFATSRVLIADDTPSEPEFLFIDQLCEQAGGLDDEPCGFAQLALGAASDLVLAAGIHRARCGAGQLRVGVGDQDAFGAALGASPSTSNVAFGVDVDSSTGCTRVGSCQGASDPSLAVLPDRDGDPTQALALWRSHAGEGDSCDTAQGARLMGLGLFVAGSAQSLSLVGSAGGRSEPLGERLATGRPALLALNAGYLIAYPALDRLELLFVPRLPDQDRAPGSDRSVGLDAADAQDPALAGLPGPMVGGSTEGGPDAGPAIADGPSGLGLAFRSGHGAETPAVHFSKLTIDAGDVPHIALGDSMVTLPAEAEIVAGPVLAYAAKGFVAEDSLGPKGGWLIMWVEQASDGRVLKAARIADKEEHIVAEPYELARGADIVHPFVYLKRGTQDATGLRFGFVDAGALHLNRLECTP